MAMYLPGQEDLASWGVTYSIRNTFERNTHRHSLLVQLETWICPTLPLPTDTPRTYVHLVGWKWYTEALFQREITVPHERSILMERLIRFCTTHFGAHSIVTHQVRQLQVLLVQEGVWGTDPTPGSQMALQILQTWTALEGEVFYRSPSTTEFLQEIDLGVFSQEKSQLMAG